MRITPIGHHDTFTKPDLLNCITSLIIYMGKGGFDTHVWVILLLYVIGIAMIPVTYEHLEGVLVVPTGLFPMDRYIWGNDYLGPP
jgi:hypothetical protein